MKHSTVAPWLGLTTKKVKNWQIYSILLVHFNTFRSPYSVRAILQYVDDLTLPAGVKQFGRERLNISLSPLFVYSNTSSTTVHNIVDQ